LPITICTPGQQFLFQAATLVTDNICRPISTCTNGFYATSNPTPTTDRVCTPCGCDANAACIPAGGAAVGVSASCPAIGQELTTQYTTTFRCACNAGYAGNGFFCGADSDNDGFSNAPLPQCASGCIRCAGDICPADNTLSRPIFLNPVNGISAAQNLVNHEVSWIFGPGVIQTQAFWQLSGSGLFVGNDLVETTNNLPSAVIADAVMAGTDLVITATPHNQTPLMANFFGVVFGYTNTENYFLASWKATDNSAQAYDSPAHWSDPMSGTPVLVYDSNGMSYFAYAQAGLQVKYINGAIPYLALWGTYDVYNQWAPAVTTLYHDTNRVSWIHEHTYEWHVSYRPIIGMYQIRIFDKTANGPVTSSSVPLIDTGAQYPSVSFAPRAQFGVYGFGLANLEFNEADFYCCDGYFVGQTCMPYTTCPNGQKIAPTATTDRVCN